MQSEHSIAILTAGLKRPPLIRKNTQALTAKENPKARAMKASAEVFGVCEMPPLPPFAVLLAAFEVAAFATCVAEKAKKRKRKVPQNSPAMAMKWLRTLFGSHSKPGIRRSFVVEGLDLKKGSEMPPLGASIFMMGGHRRGFAREFSQVRLQ